MDKKQQDPEPDSPNRTEKEGIPSDEKTPGSWFDLTPEALLTQTVLLKDVSSLDGWKALGYRDAEGDSSYDSLGFRYFACNPLSGVVPLETIPSMLRARKLVADTNQQESPALLQREQSLLKHRTIDLSLPDVKVSYQITEDTIELFFEKISNQGVAFREPWRFAISHPPQFLMKNIQTRDAAQTLNQQFKFDLPGAAWLPLDALIDCGRFKRYQDWSDSHVTESLPGSICLFISHRWRSSENPDDSGEEAALIAWQLVDQLFEAILVAHRRGLNNGRQFSKDFGIPIGFNGNELAEAIIVNVLRYNLDGILIDQAVAEALPLETHLGPAVIESARHDPGLHMLRKLLQDRPIFSGVLNKIHLWYDYACLPQPPRSESEQTFFEQALQSLPKIQMNGRTLILLDEPESYLSRAWCTLESMGAEIYGEEPDIIHTVTRTEQDSKKIKKLFMSVAQDRPHLIRRAILDTELHKIQDGQTCFKRLGINLHDPADLPFVYQTLKMLSRPRRLHVDPGSLVTGCFPLPLIKDGGVLLHPDGLLQELVDRNNSPESIDVTGTHDLSKGRAAPPHQDFGLWDEPRCAHVIIVDSSEGDSALLADWATRIRDDLQRTLGMPVNQISWLADDIAPVGHFVFGDLKPVLDSTHTWLILATSVQFNHGPLCNRLLTLAAYAERQRVVLLVDQPELNLLWLPDLEPPKNQPHVSRFEFSDLDLEPVHGGVFSAAFSGEELFVKPPEAVERAPLEDKIEPPEHLQAFVVNAFFEGEKDLVRDACVFHTRSVFEHFPTWVTVPEQLRDDPRSVQAYVMAMALVAKTMQELGYPQLNEMLAGEDNLIGDINERFTQVRVLEQNGDYAGSSSMLLTLLEELQPLQGSMVHNLRPKILGNLGSNAFHTGNIDQALDYTRRALQACEEAGDEEGMAIYQANLQLLEYAGSPSETATQLAAAQRLSDQGRYQSSNALLETAIGSIPKSDPLSSKALGLRGANHHWLGDKDAAIEDTQQAGDLAAAVGDIEGMRVYSNNLTVIRGDV